MNLRRPFRTNRRLWLACAAATFVLLGFVHLHNQGVENKVGPTHLWGVVEIAIRCAAMPGGMDGFFIFALLAAVYAAVLAVPAAARRINAIE